METKEKEAIKFLNIFRGEEGKRTEQFFSCDEWNLKLDNIIALLQQGEADSKELKITKEELKRVWQMWEEFKLNRGDRSAFVLCKPSKGTIRDDMESLQQKYFPKDK